MTGTAVDLIWLAPALALLGFYLPAERTRLLNSLYRTSQ